MSKTTSNEAAPDAQRPEGFESVGAILNRMFTGRDAFAGCQIERAQREVRHADRKLPPFPNRLLTSAELNSGEAKA